MDGNNNITTETLHFFYDAQSRPAFVEYNGEKYGYIYNLQGDVMALVDAVGTLVIKNKYDAWGRQFYQSGSMSDSLGTLNPFRYRGYVYDTETGLYYLRSRYYTASMCRFLQMDSIIAHNEMRSVFINVFAYGNNTPIITVDRKGGDAVFITDAYSFTHSSVLIQDENNDWHYFYWGASQNGSLDNSALNMGSNASMSAGKENVCVIYEKIELDIQSDIEDEILKALNAKLAEDMENEIPIYNYRGTYDKALYLKGDFSASHKVATKFKMNAPILTYDIITMNCAHAALYVLLPSFKSQNNTKATNVIYRALTKIIPVNIHGYLKKKLTR